MSKDFWSRVAVRDLDECWEWNGYRSAPGYGRYRVPRSHYTAAHRFAYELAHGQIPAGMFVCHACDNPACVNPLHLWVGTAADNNRDCREKGRARGGTLSPCRGESSPKAKLTRKQVDEIRVLRAEGATQDSLAAQFGVSRATIWNIVHKKTWR